MKSLQKVILLTLAGTIGLSYGCSNKNLGMSQFPTYQPLLNLPQYEIYRKKDMKKWTIIVHLGADNNLYDYGFTDIEEMSAGLKSSDINVIVLFDGTKQGDSVIYKIQPGGKEVVDDGGAVIPSNKEINSGDPKVLAKFTQWAIKQFPAEHYMLDIWDHGSGIFKQDLRRKVTRSFAYDDHGTNMETKDLTSILASASQSAGKRIDILGFDACLMGHLEIAYQVKNYCNILVASETLEPGDGWDYKGWLTRISKSRMTAPEVASNLVDAYGQYYADSRYEDVTLSAININSVAGEFLPVFNQFASVLQNGLASYSTPISNARTNTQIFSNTNCADIGHFLKNIKEEKLPSDIINLGSKALDAYKKSIICEYHSTGATWGGVGNATGMVVYFPKSYHGYNSSYDNPQEILFAQEQAWGNFLKKFVKE